MSDLRKPQKHDLVMGGNNPLSVNGLVLGGIEGIKSKFDRNNTDQQTLNLFEEALKYGEEGENWLHEVLEKETGETQWISALLLSEIANKPYKKLFYKPKKKSQSSQIVGVIKKDKSKTFKKQDPLEYILKLVPTEREKKLVEYFKHIILNERSQWNIWRKKYYKYMLYLRELDLVDCDLYGILII